MNPARFRSTQTTDSRTNTFTSSSMGFLQVVSPTTPDRITEDPAQKGQELRTGGELLRDRAPKDRATMEPPSSSCSKPRDSSGRRGSSSREPVPASRDDAKKARGLFLKHGSESCEAPLTGQQEPGRTTGRDMWGGHPVRNKNRILQERVGQRLNLDPESDP